MSAKAPETPSRSNARHFFRWAAIAVALLLVLVIVLLFTVFKTGLGRDVVLSQAKGFLPPDALTWSKAEGTLSGGLVLHELRYALEGTEVAIERAELDLAGAALAGGKVHVRRVNVHGVTVDLPPSEESVEPFPERITLPDSLPSLVLPVSVQIDALQATEVVVRQSEASLIAISALETDLAMSHGEVSIQSLTLASDKADLRLQLAANTAENWRSNLRAEGQWHIPHHEAIPLTLVVTGDLSDLRIDVTAEAGSESRVVLLAQGGLPNPRLNLDLNAPLIDLQRLGLEGAPLSVALQADGDLTALDIAGSLSQGDIAITLAPSTVAYDNAFLTLSPLAINAFQGHVELTGRVGLSGNEPDLQVALLWSDIVLPGSTTESRVGTQGQLSLRGLLSAYDLNVDGKVLHENGNADVILKGQGSLKHLTIESLKAVLPTGSLIAEGRVAWEPEIEAELNASLDQFDPSYFVPGLSGNVNAQLKASGGMAGDTPYGQAVIEEISGSVTGRPLGGRAEAVLKKDGSGQADVSLGIGVSRVSARGDWDENIDVVAEFNPLNLADVLPDGAGKLDGSVRLSGAIESPNVVTKLQGDAIAYADQMVGRIAISADIQELKRGSLSLDASKLQLGGQAFNQLAVSGQGNLQQHEVTLMLEGAPVRVDTLLKGGFDARNEQWRGAINSLNIAPKDSKAWALNAPAELAYHLETSAFNMRRACLEALPAVLCAEVQSAAGSTEAGIVLNDLDLSDFDAFVAAALDHPASLQGKLSANGQFTLSSNGDIRGQAALALPTFVMRTHPQSPRTIFEMSALSLNLTMDPKSAMVSLDSNVADSGYLRGEIVVSNPSEVDGELAGNFSLNLPDITVLSLFTDQVVSPKGVVTGQLAIAGTRVAPRLNGDVLVSGFSAELPALGISPKEGEFRLASQDASSASLSGRLKLGNGEAIVDGNFDLTHPEGLAGKISISGENLTVMSTPQARVRATPNIRVELEGAKLKVRGNVGLPYARVDLEHLESVTGVSSDVVIIDEAAVQAGMLIDADVTVALGEDVRLNGFGFNGSIDGQLRVRDRPGRPTTARGSLNVGGAYKAYGQDLTITRGHVAYSSTPIGNPSLDIRAERKIDAITAGVQVRGTALQPELTLWSDPVMEQAEQLSYLVLGRPLRSASKADGSQLTQAAAAMGGNLLAKKLGSQLGIDDVGVSDNRALGGAALMVGMNLSPRLHVSYGVALFGTGQVMTLKYLLSRLWTIQIDSGTENRAALNYRLER